MRRIARLLAGAGIAVVALVATAAPASAHGVGGRGDLPLPLWQFTWGAAFAVLISFAALGLLWTRPRLRRASTGRELPRSVDRALWYLAVPGRILALALALVTVGAALFGDQSPAANLSPVAVYVVFWVGLQVVSAVLGDVWRAISPFDTIAAIAARVRAAIVGGPPPGPAPEQAPAGETLWPAAAGLAGFAWLELAYHDPSSPRIIGIAAVVYTAAVLGVCARRGRAWLRAGEGFGVLFGLLAHLSPFYRDERGRLRARVPFSGLAALEARRGTVAVVMVVLGSTTFDGLGRTRFWGDVVADRTGWDLTAMNTVGLLWTIGLVWLGYLAATRLTARLTDEEPGTLADTYVGSLIPIVLAYTIAHYFSLVVFEGQTFVFHLSDPFGQGWDLFGTSSWEINFLLVSVGAIAWVQALSIVAGHVVGVTAAHDRSVERFSPTQAVRSQYPMLALMVAYTVVGLTLLLGA